MTSLLGVVCLTKNHGSKIALLSCLSYYYRILAPMTVLSLIMISVLIIFSLLIQFGYKYIYAVTILNKLIEFGYFNNNISTPK